MNLFNVYIFIEIGGTGGGCFRYMYARFLKDAARLTGDKKLEDASALMDQSGRMFSEIGLKFKDYGDKSRLGERIAEASEIFTAASPIGRESLSLARLTFKRNPFLKNVGYGLIPIHIF